MEIKYTKSEKDAFEWLSGMLRRSHSDKNSEVNKSHYYELKNWVDSIENAEMVPESNIKEKAEQPKPKKSTAKKAPVVKKKKAPSKNTKPVEPGTGLDPSGLNCLEHVSYQGMRVPRKDCDACWEVYRKLNINEYPAKRRSFEAKLRANK